MNLGQNKIDDLGNPWVFAKLLYSPWSSYENGVLSITKYDDPNLLLELQAAYDVGVALVAFLKNGKNGFDLSIDSFKPNMLMGLGYLLEKSTDGNYWFVCVDEREVMRLNGQFINGAKIFAGSRASSYKRILNRDNPQHKAIVDRSGFVSLVPREVSVKEMVSGIVDVLEKKGVAKLPLPLSKSANVRQCLWNIGISPVSFKQKDGHLVITKRTKLADELSKAEVALRDNEYYFIKTELSANYIYQHLMRIKSDLGVKVVDGKTALFYREKRSTQVAEVKAIIQPVAEGVQSEGQIFLKAAEEAQRVRSIISSNFFGQMKTKLMFNEDHYILKVWKK